MAFGTQQLTAVGIIGKSGDPVTVFGVQFTSGGTASVVSLYNGPAASGTPYFQGTGVINQTTSPANFPSAGIYFPGGCYVSWDGNGSGANVQYQMSQTI